MSPSIAPSIPLAIPLATPLATPIASPVIPPLAPPTPQIDSAIVAPAGKSIASPTSTWTPERIEQLRACVGNGMTCSQIAAEIGVSRNAVIGKIHRLGLSSGRPAGASTRANCPPRARHPRGPTQRRLLRLAYAQILHDDAALLNVAVASVHPCSLIEIADRQCRWPIGDPAATNFLFCGNDSIAGFAYCVGHARMAYRAPTRR